MKKSTFATCLLILAGIWASPANGQVFDPAVDGWYFENWGETDPHCLGSCDLSWDLYRRTYLGINPTHDCVEAPLDCAFYEIFKMMARGGNCGGMSLLGLSLFKYGGYMGFCGPANFYTGEVSPDRDDLHRAINIMQARQFSAAGITNFIDLADAGNLNNALAAYDLIRESLGKGDYPVICLANSFYGGNDAHTLIPYAIEDFPTGNTALGYGPGVKVIYLWDPNNPYDDDPAHYGPGSTGNRLVIRSSIDWDYSTYDGTGIESAWCFAVPMSVIRPKSRHPMALDILADAFLTVFVGGPGASVSQIKDGEGRQLYNTDSDAHLAVGDLETDPDKKIPGVFRWPWFGMQGEEPPGELYFVRARGGKIPDLEITIAGTEYQATIGGAGNLIRLDARTGQRAKDEISINNLATAAQSLEITTSGPGRELAVKQLRQSGSGRQWRSIEVNRLRIPPEKPVSLQVGDDFKELQVSGGANRLDFRVEMQQYWDGKSSKRNLGQLSTTPGQVLRIAPKDWRALEKTEVETEKWLLEGKRGN